MMCCIHSLGLRCTNSQAVQKFAFYNHKVLLSFDSSQAFIDHAARIGLCCSSKTFKRLVVSQGKVDASVLGGGGQVAADNTQFSQCHRTRAMHGAVMHQIKGTAAIRWVCFAHLIEPALCLNVCQISARMFVLCTGPNGPPANKKLASTIALDMSLPKD
jgi:hypothetical protein